MKYKEDGKRLSRALRKKIKQLQDFTRNHRSGPMLDMDAIRNQVRKYNTILNPTIFQRQEDYQRIGEWVISVLCDCSGSMMGQKLKYAKQSLATLAVALDKLPHVKFELYGFTDGYVDECEDVIDIKIKDYNEKFSVSKMQDLSSYYGNADGINIRTAMDRMKKFKGKKRVLVVISDGQPVYQINGKQGMQDTKEIIEKAEKENIKVIGVGIPGVHEEQFKFLYPKRHLLLNNMDVLDKLPEQLSLLILNAIDERTQKRFVKRFWEK